MARKGNSNLRGLEVSALARPAAPFQGRCPSKGLSRPGPEGRPLEFSAGPGFFSSGCCGSTLHVFASRRASPFSKPGAGPAACPAPLRTLAPRSRPRGGSTPSPAPRAPIFSSALLSARPAGRPLRFHWCERGDSNPHGLPHRILSPARLPVPPLSPSHFLHCPPEPPRSFRAEAAWCGMQSGVEISTGRALLPANRSDSDAWRARPDSNGGPAASKADALSG